MLPLGKGVCGTAAKNDETLVVGNVHEFPGHIACDSASNSEIVVPVHKDSCVIGVLDIDSPMLFSDLNVPVSDYKPKKLSYEAAVNSGRKALTIWGDEYLDTFDRIITAPHIDVYPSAKKETGAYTECWGTGTMPYVLLNYDGMESYTCTIVHEMGHAVHCELSRENQNMYNNHPNSFTGEVASLSNELTFVKFRYENAETEAEKLYWQDQIIYLFYDELFHKILLSEFEDYCYKIIEKGRSLDADDMADKWLTPPLSAGGWRKRIPLKKNARRSMRIWISLSREIPRIWHRL